MNIASNAIAFAVDTWEPAPQPPRQRHLRLLPVAKQANSGPDQRWIERFTQSVVEVLAGQRAASTLVNSLSPVVYQALRRPDPDDRLRAGKVISLRSQPLGEDSIEVAAVVGCPQRTRAVALRLHRRRDRWRCVCVLVL